MLHKVTSLSENSFRYQSPVETVTKCLHRHLSTLITLTRTSHCPYPQVTCVVVYVAAPWKVVNTREEAENLQILEARQINIAHLGWSTMLTCKRRPTLTHTQRYAAFDYMFGNRHFGGRHDTPTLTLSALYAEKNAAGPPPPSMITGSARMAQQPQESQLNLLPLVYMLLCIWWPWC